MDTRLRKASGEECDGTVIAVAGLDRMGLADVITEYLSPKEFVPPPGQGAMAVEIRADDERLAKLVSAADHAPTTAAVSAERSFLESLGGGCQVPVGAYAEASGDAEGALRLTVFMGAADGTATYRASAVGSASGHGRPGGRGLGTVARAGGGGAAGGVELVNGSRESRQGISGGRGARGPRVAHGEGGAGARSGAGGGL